MTDVWIAYSINQSFLLPCAVALRSLAASFESSPASATHALRIIVFHDGVLSDADVAKLRACVRSSATVSLEARPFNYPLPVLLCDAPHWNNIETVATLILPEMLADLPRLLFLDADTLVVGDVVDLWHLDLEGKPCACVPESDGRMPNTGVILYDVPEWNRRQLTAKCLQYVATHRTIHIDQEPFAAVDGAEFKPLPLKWNYHGVDTWMYKAHGRNLPVEDLRIVHFNGPPRPWFRNSPRRYAEDWRRRFIETPFASAVLPELRARDFHFFKMSSLEVHLALALQTRRLLRFPYVALRELRVHFHYAKYRGQLRWRSDETATGVAARTPTQP